MSATFILGEEVDFPGMNEEWAKWLPKNPPARQGAKLPIRPKGMRISIANGRDRLTGPRVNGAA